MREEGKEWMRDEGLRQAQTDRGVMKDEKYNIYHPTLLSQHRSYD